MSCCSHIVRLVTPIIIGLLLTTSTVAANQIIQENLLPGTTAWKLTRPSSDNQSQIKGYTNRLSALPGENINFHVSVNVPQTYSIRVYRMGYYGGDGGRQVWARNNIAGSQQPDCPLNATTGQITCNWTSDASMTIGASWVSGVYLAKITNAEGFDNHIPFLVKHPLNNPPELLYQQPVTTYHAYNNYPDDGITGKSTYDSRSYGADTIAGAGKPRAVRVSFDRPYENTGSRLFINLEHELIMFLEEHGYDLGYVTDIDTHESPEYLSGIEGFISAGHDEYWTGEMFTAVEQARDNGTDLAFFGANAAFWQIRLRPDASGRENRVMEVYKNASIDPEPDPARKTVTFRAINRAEQQLVGVQYIDYAVPGSRESFIARNTNHWIYQGTGMSNGDAIAGVIGGEMDVLFSNFPPPISTDYTVIGRSPILGATRQPDGSLRTVNAETVVYQAPSGAWVFASATLLWQKGLVASGGASSPALRRMTKNLLDRFVNASDGGTPTLSLASPGVTEGSGNLNINFSLSNPAPYPVSFKVSTNSVTAQPGSDFVGRFQEVTIPSGSTTTSWTVKILNDSIAEPVETLKIRVWEIQGTTNTTAELYPTIVDDDQSGVVPVLTIANRQVQETAGTVPITISLSAPTNKTVTFGFSTTTGGTATPGSDYYGLAGTQLQIPAGQTSVTKQFTVLDDTTSEGQESVRVQIYEVENARVTNRFGTITILSNE